MGWIFDIQRFSLHNGPGIRTTVFLQGCPLRCAWCHNPEGIGPSQAISFVPEQCIACGACVRVCKNRAHAIHAAGPSGDETVHVMDRQRCQVCGACAAVCDTGALELVGRDVSVDDVMREVLQDRVFYRRSGGGLTLSGGEPLVQIDFTAALLQAAKAEGLHCCLETCGLADWQRLERVLPLVDLFLYDYKESSPQRHAQYTGVSNDIILHNLRALHARGAAVRLQCPVIPGWNDTDEHFSGIAALAHELPNLEGVEILPYHPLGNAKRERLGLSAAEPVAAAPDQATIAAWVRRLEAAGVRVLRAATV